MFGLKPLLGLEPMAPIRLQLPASQANHSAPETCMYVCMYMYVCVCVCIDVCMSYVCMYVCMYVLCMYVCMYISQKCLNYYYYYYYRIVVIISSFYIYICTYTNTHICTVNFCYNGPVCSVLALLL